MVQSAKDEKSVSWSNHSNVNKPLYMFHCCEHVLRTSRESSAAGLRWPHKPKSKWDTSGLRKGHKSKAENDWRNCTVSCIVRRRALFSRNQALPSERLKRVMKSAMIHLFSSNYRVEEDWANDSLMRWASVHPFSVDEGAIPSTYESSWMVILM